jgi:RHS repeat-associated protein
VDDARWGTTTYGYDAVDQLVEARCGVRHQVFGYDPAGSLVSIFERLESASRQVELELGPGNTLLRAGDVKYASDARGRRASEADLADPERPRATQYAWDDRDQLRGATLPDGTTVTLTYDGFGRRLRKETAPPGRSKSVVTEYVWDGLELAMMVRSDAGPCTFVHEPGTFRPLLQEERGQVLAYVLDHVGTPKELLTEDGLVAWSAAHGAWGNVVGEHRDPEVRARAGDAVRSPFRLLGQIADDELGLCFTRCRIFDPRVGRWLSPDPLGIEGALNLFAFDGAPTVFVDPLGLTTGGTGGGTPHRPLWTATSSKTPAQNALRHYNDHGADFGATNALDYKNKAHDFLDNPPPGTLTKVRPNGDVVQYHPASNTFAVASQTGAPRTFFKPDPGVHGYPSNLDYFNAQ